MPNGHLTYPMITPTQASDAASMLAGVFRVFNGVSMLPALLWVGFGIMVVVAVVALLRKHS